MTRVRLLFASPHVLGAAPVAARSTCAERKRIPISDSVRALLRPTGQICVAESRRMLMISEPATDREVDRQRQRQTDREREGESERARARARATE